MCGNKCTRTGLWMIPLHADSQPTTTTNPPQSITAMAANIAATSLAGDHARYIHQALCSPTTPTLLSALARSSELKTIPGLTPQLILYHLPPSTATDKGHMRRHRQGVQSTRTQQPAILQARSDVNSLEPTEEVCSAHDMFCFAALADMHTGTMYTDGTGAFPVRSFRTCNTYLWPTFMNPCPRHTLQERWSDDCRFYRHPRDPQHPWICACAHCHGQQMLQGSRSPHPKQQNGHPPCPSPQSPSKRGRTRHCDFKRALHLGPRHSRQGLSAPTLGQLPSTGETDTKPPVILATGPNKICKRGSQRKIRLQQNSACTIGYQRISL